MIFEDPDAPAPGACPFCGLNVPGSPDACPRCGTLLGAAAEHLRHLGRTERKLIRSRKASADTLFLVGLLLGGPMITLGDQALLGGFIALAGGAASVLRRHTDWSLPGTLVIASLLAGLAATLVLEPAQHVVEETRTDDAARLAYVAALNGQDPDVLVEGRGPGAVTAWFTLSQEVAGECGRYPPPEVRAHLAELRFLRVVVAERNRMGGLCSFPP